MRNDILVASQNVPFFKADMKEKLRELRTEELAILSPENYHLLRAITGHLSELIKAEQGTRINFEVAQKRHWTVLSLQIFV